MPAKPIKPSHRLSPSDLTPEQRARYEKLKAKAKADLEAGLLGPPVEALDLDRENAAPFYFELRACIAQLKKAREAAGLTLAQVAEKTGLASETLCRLETGAVTNPTWQTLGLYAAAVGRSLSLEASTERRTPMNDQTAAQEFLNEQKRMGRQYTVGAGDGKTVALDMWDNKGHRPMNPVSFRQELNEFLRRIGHPLERVAAVEAAIIRFCGGGRN